MTDWQEHKKRCMDYEGREELLEEVMQSRQETKTILGTDNKGSSRSKMSEKEWVKAWNKFKIDNAQAGEAEAVELFFKYWIEHSKEIQDDFQELWSGIKDVIVAAIVAMEEPILAFERSLDND